MDFAKGYLDEAQELLTSLEEGLLLLEENPEDLECISRVFRDMHTIKGSGSMFGFEEIARFTHQVETLLDKMRGGEIPVTRELLSLLLKSKDHVIFLLAAQNPAQRFDTSDALLAEIAAALPGAKKAPGPAAETVETQDEEGIFWIRYRPVKNAFAMGANPVGLLLELEELGRMHAFFHDQDIPCIEDILPEEVYGWWDIILMADREDAIHEVFVFSDQSEYQVARINSGKVRSSDLEALLEGIEPTLDKDPEVIAFMLRQKFGSLLAQVSVKRKAAAPREEGAKASPQSSQSIRVDSNRLDELVNLVGEIVIIQARLTQASRTKNYEQIDRIAEDMERLTGEMRDIALTIRMLPFGTTFSTFRRLVRDLSTGLGKQVRFVTEGAETELDKTVIDRLKDPLMHILRNALDHGLEPPADRLAAGKSAEGEIRLSAAHLSGDVIITVADDGKGLDAAKIQAKAVERGLIEEGAVLSEKDLFSLICEPGFSTAASVSGVSGRGVGMDVVRKAIEALHGAVEVNSVRGQGSTFQIRMPLTLAIIDGMHVKVGPESYILPLTSVVACQERFISENVEEVETIERMGKMIPCVSLRRLLDVPGSQPKYERIIVAGVDDMLVGLAVDQVVGRQQAVIKNLHGCGKRDWIAGTTINGDGGISLILDVIQLIRFTRNKVEALAGQ